MNVNEITINSLDDINKLTNTTNYEERPLILTKRINPFIKYFIGVVIKCDKNFNVLIRYLDNPLTGDKFWWFGGLKPGIDPLLYSILDYKDFFNNSAFITTIIELAAIIKAPHSGLKTIPYL